MARTVDKSQWGGAEKFDAMIANIRKNRSKFEAQHYVSKDIVEQFQEIGIYRAFVPKKYGGDEKSPSEFLRAIEAISTADGAAGWVASFDMNPSFLSGLPENILKEIWDKSADIVFAGGTFPPLQAKVVDGGYLISGRRIWASGCMGASLFGVGFTIDGEDKPPRLAVFTKDKITIEQTWNVHGMIGTGSFDVVLEDVFVPHEWTFAKGENPKIDTAFFKYPVPTIASQVLAVTGLGMARDAINTLIALAKGRKSATGAPNLGERQYVQIEIAKAEAKWRSSRAFFYEATDELWAEIIAGNTPSEEQISMVRLATTNVARETSEAIRMAYQLSGMDGAYIDHPLSFCMRNASMLTQHAFMGEVTYQNAGAIMFGHKPFAGYL